MIQWPPPVTPASAKADGSLDARLRIFRTEDGPRLAGDLFRECFNAPFPVPRLDCGLPIPTPASNWRQYVATYAWPDGEETVGFCNWIRHRDVYLQGGMCVQRTFYRRLPRPHYAQIRARGGIAQMMMEAAARELDDALAWFGYCGDAKALAVDLRAGYVQTSRRFVIVKWFREVPQAQREAMIDEIAAIGPF